MSFYKILGHFISRQTIPSPACRYHLMDAGELLHLFNQSSNVTGYLRYHLTDAGELLHLFNQSSNVTEYLRSLLAPEQQCD
ncbi:hypothetical protein ElyMa_006821300 [Elysia marginata]|uniref:Uncharacterized protein n=1 Tax=Elysia marginata TaxID=1093978 RepID=A0AAV4J3M4_9GAST|nr:hypothetical protein ElyMa_006821300 [Elysia marginata]